MSTLFRKRDLGVLLLIIVSLYLTWYDSPSLNYSIEPSWFIDQRSEVIDDAGDLNYRQVPPLIVDLEGDGAQEVIIITSSMHLKVFNAEPPVLETFDVYHPQEVSSVELFPAKSQRGRLPVQLKSGYVSPYSPSHARSQIVVVLFDDWTVMCFDSSLMKLWEKAIAHNTFEIDRMSEFFRIQDAALHIAPLHLKEDAGPGVVIVGANMALRKRYADKLSNQDFLHPLLRMGHGLGHLHKEHPETHALSQLEHFSVFALDSSNGHVLWKHDGLEVRAEQYSRSLPQHAYSLDLKDLMSKTHHAPGINDWTVFRQSLVDELPHTWFGTEHTSMRIAHFVRRHIGAHAAPRRPHAAQAGGASAGGQKGKHKDIHKGRGRNGKPSTLLSSLPLLQGEVQRASLTESATLPHTAAEHTENPNVIVVHTRHGLEVIALRTGAPITSLALSPGRVYGDLDGDDVVDAVSVLDTPESVQRHQAEFAHHQYEYGAQALQHCMLVVMSGLPAQSQLFNGSVCQQRPSLRDPLGYATAASTGSSPDLSSGGGAVGAGGAHKTKVTPVLSAEDDHPLIVHASPLILHKLDPDTLQESKERDVIVAIHSGVVTSYSGSGKFNWQVRGAPKWSVGASGASGASGAAGDTWPSLAYAVLGFDSDAARAEDLGSHNSIYSNILVAGEAMLMLLSREGDVLASAEIPRAPLAQPVIGDFDNDGVSDIIVVTNGAVLGYHVHVTQASRTVLIALTLLIIIAVVVFISNIQAVPLPPITAEQFFPPASSAHAAPGYGEGVGQALMTGSAPAAAPTHLTRRQHKAKGGSSIFQIIRSTDEQHLD